MFGLKRWALALGMVSILCCLGAGDVQARHPRRIVDSDGTIYFLDRSGNVVRVQEPRHFGQHSRRHVGVHSQLHWTPGEGVHAGTHVGRHGGAHVGDHSDRDHRRAFRGDRWWDEDDD